MAKEIVLKISADASGANDDLVSLENKINNVSKSSVALGEKFKIAGEAFQKSAGAIAGAFSIATGAVGIFGETLGFSSAEIETAQKQATSWLAILGGIQPVIEGVTAVSKLFNAVLLANPIGLIITGIAALGAAIALLIVYWDDVTTAVSNFFNYVIEHIDDVLSIIFPIPGLIYQIVDAFNSAEESSKNMTDALLEQAEAFEEQAIASAKSAGEQVTDFDKVLQAKLRQLKSERDALDVKYNYERALAVANNENYEQLSKDYLVNVIDKLEQELVITAKYTNDLLAIRASGDDVLSELLIEAQNKQKEIQSNMIKDLEDARKNLESIEQKEKDDAQKSADDRRAEFDRVNAERAKQSELERNIAQIEADYLRQIQEDAAAETKRLRDERLAQKEEEVEINFDIIDANTKKNEEAALKEYQNAYELYLKKKGLSETEFNDQRQLEEQKLGMISDSFALASSLTELFGKKSKESAKKAFLINKAAGIAQAGIQTYQSAQGAYLSQLTIPSPDAPIRATIAAGIATAAGLVNIAKIASQKFDESGTSGGSAGSASVASASLPSVNPGVAFDPNVVGQASSQNNSVNQAVQEVGATRVFVTETDITAVQNKVAVIQQKATIN